MVDLLKLDLACGQNKREGFTGVDIFDGADIKWDLTRFPWPWGDGGCEELHASHFLEHLDGEQHIDFMNEAYRVLKPEGRLTVIVPHWNNSRMWGDPTHKRALSEWWAYYWSRPWREANKLTHGPYERIVCNFEILTAYHQADPRWVGASEAARSFANTYYSNTVLDTHFICTKKE